MCYLFLQLLPFTQGESIPSEKLKALGNVVDPWFMFALVWSVGASCDGQSRKKFDRYLRDKIAEDKVLLTFTCSLTKGVYSATPLIRTPMGENNVFIFCEVSLFQGLSKNWSCSLFQVCP